MNGQDLRNSILQLAIQGKLVEQRQEEGTAKELLEQIREEKERLLKEGKIKKQKALPEITEDEIPFDIPEGWEWIRIGNVIELLSGQDFPPEKYNDSNKGIPYITGASSLSNTGVLVSRWTEEARCIANEGDILLVCKGSGYGKTVICDVKEAHIARQIMSIQYTEFVNMMYINCYLRANYAFIKARGQGVIPGIDRQSILNMLFPLPPLEEQKRIVSKIEELLPYVDQYDEAHAKVEELNKKFPEEMQKSILQYAIKGKLVEQRQDEGTAEELYQQIQAEKAKLVKEGKIKREKPLPAITEDEIPFDIPESWKWVRLGYVTNYGVGKQVNKTEIPSKSWILELEDIEKATYRIIEKRYDRTPGSSKHSFSAGDILYGKLRPYLKKCVVVNEGGYCSTEIVPFKGYCGISSEYLMYCMTSPLINYAINSLTYGMDMPRLGTKDAVQLLIPLPPLEEQKRIVAKIEELMPYTKQLVK